MFAVHLEPSFLGRVDVNLDETGKPEDFRGGFIWPSNAGCLIYGTSSGGASVSDTDGETGRAQKNTIYYKYEVLQVSVDCPSMLHLLQTPLIHE